jgi:CheY-like chemotaxis protein
VINPPCCMIVEDQALSGMALEAYLEDAGFSVAGPFPSCADALQWLEHNTPQVAVLDVSLRDGTSLPVAQALKGRNTPFAIYSGLPYTTSLPEELKDVPRPEKPAPRKEPFPHARPVIRVAPSMERDMKVSRSVLGSLWNAAPTIQ